MCYVKYEQDIVSKHKVELVGWPAAIKFSNPSKIGTVKEIRKLRQALKVGDCKWIAQSRRQQAAYAAMLAVKEAAGERVIKKRKERSDKGKMRAGAKGGKKAATGKSSNTGKGCGRCAGDKQGGVACGNEDDNDNDEEEEEEDQQPPKKKRKSATAAKARAEKKLLPNPKSTQFIVDSDYDDDE
jgi:hypothetical protein